MGNSASLFYTKVPRIQRTCRVVEQDYNEYLGKEDQIPQMAMGRETPCDLVVLPNYRAIDNGRDTFFTYDTEAVIPVDSRITNPRGFSTSKEHNSMELLHNLDLLGEKRDQEVLCMVNYQ